MYGYLVCVLACRCAALSLHPGALRAQTWAALANGSLQRRWVMEGKQSVRSQPVNTKPAASAGRLLCCRHQGSVSMHQGSVSMHCQS
jgi:hypothetical protein